MYRLFSMDKNGSLFQLSSKGWVRENGLGTTFESQAELLNFLDRIGGTPALPRGQFMVDTYIAKVNIAGMILETEELSSYAD